MLIAKRFIEEGGDVAVHGFTENQANDAVAELRGGYPVFGDICHDDGTNTLIEQIKSTTEILVNNYGTAESGRWETLSSTDWVDLYQKNVLSAERLIQAFLPDMKVMNRARIINLGTVGSTRPSSRNPHYYAAKGALATMTVSLAKEVAGTNIRVNLVSPGMILTPEVQRRTCVKAALRVGEILGQRSNPTLLLISLSGVSFGATRSPTSSRSSQVKKRTRYTDKISASTAARWTSSRSAYGRRYRHYARHRHDNGQPCRCSGLPVDYVGPGPTTSQNLSDFDH